MPGPKCPICDRVINPAGYIEMSVVRVIGSSVVPLGSQMFHIDCYMNHEDELHGEEGESREVPQSQAAWKKRARARKGDQEKG